MRNRVTGIYYVHENEALSSSSRGYCEALRKKGFLADCVDISTPEGLKKLAAELDSGETAFCFGLQGVGSNLSRHDINLWTATQTPFIGLHYDNPCYNMNNHINASAYVANLYHFESFLEIQRRYLGGDQVNELAPIEIFDPLPPSHIPFQERAIKYLFLKTGAPLDEFIAYFNSLPEALGRGVWTALDLMWNDPNLSICDSVAELFKKNGYDRQQYHTQFWAVVQSMDYYLRRKRAITFVDWLKFQEGAVIIGQGWDFIDRTDARAEFRPAIPMDAATHMFNDVQYICNTNPYGRDLVHERVINGLIKECCVISDSNVWWDQRFSNVPALIRFGWDRPLEKQLAPRLRDPMAAEVMSKTGRTPAIEQFSNHRYIECIIACADRARKKAERTGHDAA